MSAMNRSRAYLATAVVSVVVLGLLLPAGAAAFPMKGGFVEGGKARLKFDRALLRAMEQAGARVQPLKPAKAERSAVVLPIKEGNLEPRFGSGYLFQRGGIRLRAGGRSVALRRLVLNTAKQRLSGAVAGHSIAIAKVDQVRAGRTNFGIFLGVDSLRLTAKAAAILGGRLRLPEVFRANRPMGELSARATLGVVPVTRGSISLLLDPAFRQKLESLGISVAPTGMARQVPVTDQNGAVVDVLAYEFPDVEGEINRGLTHGGIFSPANGLQLLQADGSTTREVTWNWIGVNFENGFGGEGSDVALARWGGVTAVGPIGQIEFGSPSYDEKGALLSDGPVPATLSSWAVGPLNEVFGKGGPAPFATGEPLGWFSFVAGVS